MTAAELIALLAQLPPGAHVVVPGEGVYEGGVVGCRAVTPVLVQAERRGGVLRYRVVDVIGGEPDPEPDLPPPFLAYCLEG